MKRSCLPDQEVRGFVNIGLPLFRLRGCDFFLEDVPVFAEESVGDANRYRRRREVLAPQPM